MIPTRYKGERKDNGRWIEGFLVEHDGKQYIIPPDEIHASIYVPDNTLEECCLFEVVPETVCLYLGKTRQDGSVALWVNIKQLFEGWWKK